MENEITDEDFITLQTLVKEELEKKYLESIIYCKGKEVTINVFPTLLPKLVIFSTTAKYKYPEGLHSLFYVNRVAKYEVLEETLGNIPFFKSYSKGEILAELYIEGEVT